MKIDDEFNMKTTLTYKEISPELQKVKTENIYNIIAGALKRNATRNVDRDIKLHTHYREKERVLLN
ncbi:MAG: hypothetical protein ACUZ8H_09555 [Candidatus Anammoxibacter sp.]